MTGDESVHLKGKPAPCSVRQSLRDSGMKLSAGAFLLVLVNCFLLLSNKPGLVLHVMMAWPIVG